MTTITLTPENISSVSNSELIENYYTAKAFLKSATEAEEIGELCYIKIQIEKEAFKRKLNLQ